MSKEKTATTKTNKKQYKKTATLTPAKKKFAVVYAKTDNGTEAIRQAFPDTAAQSSPTYVSLKANRLIRNAEVSKEIAHQKQKIEYMATKALNRIDELVTSDDEQVAGQNSRWIYEQVHGKAVQKSSNINFNFTQEIDNKQSDYNL